MAFMRGVVRFCLARPHLGSGRNYSSWCPLVPVFAIRSSFFLVIFFFLKTDFSTWAFTIVLFVVAAVLDERFEPCEAWWLRSIGRGGFCSDLPRCAFLLHLKIQFRFTVLFYIVCYVLLHLERDFTLLFSANFHNVFMLGYMYLTLNCRFWFAVALYIVCRILLHLKRDFTLVYLPNFTSMFTLSLQHSSPTIQLLLLWIAVGFLMGVSWKHERFVAKFAP